MKEKILWQWFKENPDRTLWEARCALGWSRWETMGARKRLDARGLLIGTGAAFGRTYRATGTSPRDGRGRSPGSQIGQRLGRLASHERQRARYGVRIKPEEGTLEHYLGWGA